MKQILLAPLFLLSFLLTENLSAQWVQLNSGTTDNFLNLDVVNDQVAYGFGYTVVKTTDGGNSWNPLTINTVSSWINTGFFVDAQTGWIGGKYGAIGGEILKTTNGGASWVSQEIISDVGINDLHFIDAQMGWAASFGGKLLRTTDGGNNWVQVHDFQEEIEDMQFTSAQIGWAISYGGTLYKSNDGGDSWSMEDTDLGYGLFFLDMDRGWVTGKDGEMYHTADGGLTWNQQNTNYSKPMTSVRFADALNGWAVGGVDCRFGGCVPFQKVLATTDGGLSWLPQTHNGDSVPQIDAVDFGNTAAFACGNDGQIIKLQTSLTPGEGPLTGGDFTLYPNPSNGSVHVDIPLTWGQGTLRVYASNGQLIQIIEATEGLNRLESKEWVQGAYLIQFSNENHQKVKYLITQ